ncbi:MDR family MFS transporter [Rhodanobacter sp. MP7CTX1]|uniref:MDR family MFS transporter n=1 Tax=Rhodanobacter sp. MP7CTX1 TaxID=2723084 RepID=UPI00179AC556|nr:MDR family MFS transporter [Rhodanobacter sp. MP7CTX1]MBB6187509.1 DHA2 family multidrug resistance protein [Rhodanobacter sp. MP7CTX1]
MSASASSALPSPPIPSEGITQTVPPVNTESMYSSPVEKVPFRTWIAVIGSTLGAFLAILNIQVVGASLADIQGAIGTGTDEGGWITTAYLVAEIIIIPLSGWLAKVFSLRTYLLTNIVLFVILSAACAFAQNLDQMIVLRALQGIAGGVLIPLAFSIIMTRLPRSLHTVGMAIYSVSVVFAPSIGPVLGGYFNDNFGWQSIFFISVPPGILMFGMLWYALDRSPRQFELLRKGDWTGIALMAVGLGSLETVLEEGNKDDWFGSSFILRLAIVAVVCLVGFVINELRTSHPLLHLRLLARRNFGLGTVANFIFGFSMYGWIYLVPQYLSSLQGYDAQQIGGVLIWIGLPQLVIIPFTPKLMRYFDGRTLATAGFVMFIVGSMLAGWTSANFSGPQFLGSSLMRAVAQALVMAPLSAVAIAGIEHEFAPSASALFNMMRNLGGAVGIAVLQTFLTKREQFHSNMLTENATLINEYTQRRIDSLTHYFLSHGVSDLAYARHEAIVGIGRAIRRQSFFMGFSDTFIMQSVLLVAALLFVILLKKAGKPSGGVVDSH